MKSPQISTSKQGFPGAACGSGSRAEKVGHTASRLEIPDQAQKKAGVLLSSESLLGALSELDIRPGFWNSDFPCLPPSLMPLWYLLLWSLPIFRGSTPITPPHYKSLLLWITHHLLSKSLRWQMSYVAIYCYLFLQQGCRCFLFF